MRRLEVSRWPDERWPGVPEQPARRSKTRVMRAARGRCECHGPRGRISRRPCLQRGGLRPQTTTGGLGRRELKVTRRREEEERGEGGFPPADWRWPVCSGVGHGRSSVPSPSPPPDPASMSRGHGLGPAPRLPPRSTRTAKRCPFRLRDGLERPSCHVLRGETSPLLATLSQGTMAPVGREDPRWGVSERLAAGRLQKRLGGPTTLLGKT